MCIQGKCVVHTRETPHAVHIKEMAHTYWRIHTGETLNVVHTKLIVNTYYGNTSDCAYEGNG